MKKACVWVAREWPDGTGKLKREKKPDATVRGVKPSDRWVVQWIEPSGRRRLEKMTRAGRDGLADAFARKAELEHQLLDGSYQAKPDRGARVRLSGESWAGFRQLFERNHLTGNPDLRPSTAALYRQSLDLFEQKCSPQLLTDVTTAMVLDFRGVLFDDETGPETIKRHLRGLRCAVRKAWEWELLERLPRFPNLTSGSNEPRPLPDEHFKAIYAACEVARYPSANDQPYAAADWWRGAIVLAIFSGLRRNEWLNLPWADVSLDARELVIRKARNKSKRDDRIPMHDVAVSHLRKLTDYGKLVFPFERYWLGGNQPLGKNTLYGEWRAIQAAAGLKEPYSFHNLRDTCLNMFGRTMSPTQLHAFSRHADFSTTDRHYLAPSALLRDSLAGVSVPDFLNS